MIKIHRNVLFPFVLHGCETWSVTLREEGWVLRTMLWRKRVEVTGDLRRLHNEKFHDLYSSINVIRVIKSR
jgi:hypothetical protein